MTTNQDRRGFSPLDRGTMVEFRRGGKALTGKIVSVLLDASRKPGIARVRYAVRFDPAYYPIEIPAASVTAVVAEASKSDRLRAPSLRGAS